jgi:ribonuclease R
MARKEKKEKGGQVSFFKDKVFDILAKSKSALSIKQLIRKLGLRKRDEKLIVQDLVDDMVKTQKVSKLKNGTFRAGKPGADEHLTGVVDFVNPRFAFIVIEGMEFDIKVSSSRLKNALDGDIVKVAVYAGREKGKNPEGEVVEIVQRGRADFVGTIEISAKYAFVLPDKRKMYCDIFVPQEKIANAKNGDKVIVKITEYPTRDKNPVGEVIAVLGPAGDNDVEMHAIMAEFGLPYEFPVHIVAEAEKIPGEITQEEIARRRDFRDITTFTIDPVDAKDFDDALSIRRLENGNWEIGVHIADVSHYVRPGSILDKEGYKRATSVYLVDRTIPMLPERLSNNLCSLRPKEDKLTFSAVFELDHHAKIINQWFGKTIIHSDRRFAYEEVQQIIESGEGDFKEEIHVLNDLAHKLRKDRFAKGAISFETVEVKFRLDEKGKPLEVVPKIRKDAHKLIEDFMLLANRKVAEYVYFKHKGEEKLTMVYRIHEHPDVEKLNALSAFAKKFGYTIDFGKGNLSQTLNKLTDDVEGKPEQNVLQNLAIRTMAKAKYTTDPEIHFGLAYKHYTHFTSPIRRYPDVMVHRLLEHYLEEGKSENKEFYESLCEHSSEMEKLAAEAERASIKYKQVEFMQGMEDKEFEGIVSGLTDYGLFVEMIENRCEGMVRLSEIEDDYYELDSENYRLIGKRNKKIITLGDHVRVKVKNTNLHKRTIDLTFA